MKSLLLSLLLIAAPVQAFACIIAPENATKEKIQIVPEGYYGFHVKLLAIKALDGSKKINLKSLPHDEVVAEAEVIENYGPEVPKKIALTFGPCSVEPEVGLTYNLLASPSEEMDGYMVEDHPSFVIDSTAKKK